MHGEPETVIEPFRISDAAGKPVPVRITVSDPDRAAFLAFARALRNALAGRNPDSGPDA